MSGLVLSLFPGLGLLDMAFEGEGFTVVRGPDVLWGGDIRVFNPPPGRFEGIIGGPPCQAFSSLSHLIRANGFEPKFGNLIPEYERCVREAEPAWFLMENVRAAPTPEVEGYATHDFMLNNAWIPGEDGFGEEQERLRRFTFGRRGDQAVNLMRWIQPAALMLMERSRTCTNYPVNNARERKRTVTALGPDHLENLRQSTNRARAKTVTAAHGGPRADRPDRFTRYTFAEACRLQGLPEDFLEHAPFTKAGKLKAVANGVPLPMGRAVAKAVRAAAS